MTTSQYQSLISYNQTATIASSGTTSEAIDLSGATLCGFIMPAAFTGATLGLLMSDAIDGTYVTVQDGEGSNLALGVAASKYIPLSNLSLSSGLRFIKLVSGSSEAAQRVIRLATRAM